MTLLLTTLSVVMATLPIVALLALVWWVDRYDREPPWLVATVFGWGAVGAVALAMPASMLLHAVAWLALHDVTPAWFADRIAILLVAPLVEEPCKAVAIGLVLFNKHFDNMTDGFVYGAAAGLGFGMTENLWYFLALTDDPAAWGSAVVLRTFYSAVMHAMCTAVFGACAGHARFRERQVFVGWAVLGMGLAMAIHALWNGLASHPADGWFAADLILLPLELLGIVAVFELCVWDEARTIRRQLADEVAAGWMPPDHPEILASWTRRARGDWLDPGVDRPRYVRLATHLAMRKQQLADAGSGAPLALDEEVHRLRDAVQALLGAPAAR